MTASASIARIVLIFSAESFFKERRIIIIIYSVGALGVELVFGRISVKGNFMDNDAPGVDVGTKCGHPCVRLDGRPTKHDFGCCICMGETQLCTSCEKRRLAENPVGQNDESVNTPGSRHH